MRLRNRSRALAFLAGAAVFSAFAGLAAAAAGFGTGFSDLPGDFDMSFAAGLGAGRLAGAGKRAGLFFRLGETDFANLAATGLDFRPAGLGEDLAGFFFAALDFGFVAMFGVGIKRTSGQRRRAARAHVPVSVLLE